MSDRHKYGMNSIGKAKPEMEEKFGNEVHTVGQPIPLPKPLVKWLQHVKETLKPSWAGDKEDWRPRGSGDPKAYPAHYNKKDKV